VPVRRAADVEAFRIGKLRGVAVGGANAQRHRRAGGMAMPPISTGSTIMRLPSWFELS
jgi:hypothetical protein